MNISPEELEKIIQNVIEKALKKAFIRYLKLAIGVPIVLILIISLVAFTFLKLNGQ
ncbi:hypothetical protein HH682_03165 [Rosenbergiella sp. S61]|uniref:Uncharacterized protein n=1 Tax=Rosenbergiella gaditana TaxID=2726987 RepID=A0ABS5STN2_9GAMM|nr:hypothetical protein [Rosenbergiella gaditana]MBT0723458.1 hypothetical protein [Rosenbergiella gaditana]